MTEVDLVRLGIAVSAAFAGYLSLVVGAIALASARGSARRRHQILRRVPRPFRRLVASAASALVLLLGAPAGADPAEPTAGFTLRAEEGLEATPPADSSPAATSEDQPAEPMDVTPSTPVAEPTATAWTVVPGDHLWSIAERTLAHAGRPTDDANVGRYWSRLVAVNRHQMSDPDLIHPGDVVTVPPLPA